VRGSLGLTEEVMAYYNILMSTSRGPNGPRSKRSTWRHVTAIHSVGERDENWLTIGTRGLYSSRMCGSTSLSWPTGLGLSK
jgi:hypothetical protein